MNWVNSLGTLLESVDQHAALTLAGSGGGGGGAEAEGSGAEDGGVEDESLLSTIKKGISRATGSTKASEDEWEAEDDAVEEGTQLGRGGGGGLVPVRSPPGSTSSATSVRQTPPSSSSGIRGTSSPALTASPSSARDSDISRLQKENARLKSELRLKEKALATQQQSVQVYEDEIEALEKECTNKIAETQQQMAQLRMEKDADEKNFVQALELKETQVQALQSDLQTAQEAVQRQTQEIEQLRTEVARAEESKDSLWTNAASASQQTEEVVTSLRLELQETQTSLSHAKREFADSKSKMYERQALLEKTNAELSTSVATLERELAKAREEVAKVTGNGLVPGSAGATTAAYAQIQDEHRKVQQTLVVTKKTLHDEIRKNEIHVQEIQSLSAEVKRLKDAVAAAQDETSNQVITLTKANAELQEKLAHWELHAAQQTASKDAEARIRTLTNRLIEKQESIDALRSKITTLDVRLADAQSHRDAAEHKLAQIERNGGVVAVDMEMGTSVAVGRKGGARVRSNRMANAISRVAPVVERSARVVSALDGLDRWLLFLGRVFLSMPVARLALLCYVALIHFWVFMVLSFHTSHLNEEVHESATGAAGVAAKGHGLGAPGMFPDGMQQTTISRLLRASLFPGHESSHVSRSASSSPASSPLASPAQRRRLHPPPHYVHAPPPPTVATAPPLTSSDDVSAFAYVEMSEHTSVSPSSLALDVHDDHLQAPPPAPTAAELAWLRRCLPIFVQPEVDVSNGNGLVKVFFRFERDDTTGRLDCKLCVVLAGEASYNRVWEKRENLFATLMYRTFNRKTYKRTADINYMDFRGVDLNPESATPWGSIFSFDHGGDQRWAQGDKADICCWFSLMHHYKEDIALAAWRREGFRPFVYLNTCNHMIGEHDTNTSLSKHEWSDYAFQEGDAEDAFHYAVDHVPTKCNLYSLVCCLKARNGDRAADGLLRDCGGRGRDGIPTRTRESIYLQGPASNKTSST